MNCSQVNDLLDQLMDGELSDEQRQAMEAHGRECAECAAAIRSTMQLKALFAEMSPEADVPLAAQAKWRNAVRDASKQGRQRHLRRWIASAAAAAVVLVGVSLAFSQRIAPKQSVDAMPALEAAVGDEAVAISADGAGEARLASNGVREDAVDSAVVEADGVAEEAVAIDDDSNAMAAEEESESVGGAYDGQRAPVFELSLKVDNVDTACARIRELVQEYEGSADVQPVGDTGANIYVEITSDNAIDFLNAVLPLDGSGQTVELPDLSGGGRELLLLVLYQ